MDGVAYCELTPEDCPAVPLRLVTRREPGSAILRNFVDLVRRESRAAGEPEPTSSSGPTTTAIPSR